MSYPLCFPRALGRPGLTGRIRERPGDFQVAEELGFEPSGQGEHVFLYVRKTNANTGWVAGELARLAGVRARDVSYGGRKDRHAVTEQWFSCRLPGRMEPAWTQLEPAGIEVLRSRRHVRKLRIGSHEGNRFRIRVRALRDDGAGADVAAALAPRIEAIGRDGFPNYFGEQRFGIDSGNLVRANELFMGKQFARGRQGLYISAARSYLFNRELSRRVADGGWLDGEPEAWLRGRSRSELPAMNDPELAHWEAGLESLGVKAMRRQVRIVPGELQYQIEADSLVVSFTLPSGSYATSLLRELVAYKDASRVEEKERTLEASSG